MENTEKMGGKVVRDLRDSGVLDSAFPAYQKREMQAMAIHDGIQKYDSSVKCTKWGGRKAHDFPIFHFF